jgi:D-beta-D-heptose 7-phosphate kinase/D-beta-D-heptose 1-phosphate adenosyltransferase
MNNVPIFDSIRILCIGDLMLDRFVDGSVDRISPESPVPIVLFGDTKVVPGGAANVARNIVALGGRCTLIGVVGNDQVGDELVALLDADDRISTVIARDDSRPTTEKTRFVAQGQHLLRVDRETAGEVQATVLEVVLLSILEEMPRHDVIVLSDYAKGLLTDGLVRRVVAEAKKAGIALIADPKTVHLERFAGATVITPNVAEAAAATGIRVIDDDTAEDATRAIAARYGIEAVLLTRADQGMTLLRGSGEAVHVRATARDVFDVVGAGDTVVATISVGLAAGLDMQDAARLANTAAGLVVAKHRTATITRNELLEELAKGHRGAGLTSAVKILDRSAAQKRSSEWRAAKLEIGFTNGCFDILHAGHVRLLQYARAQCDRLIVGLNGDASVSRLKGESRPINGLDDRAEVLAALASVDAVVSFDEDTPYELIKLLEPDLLVKGAEYAVEDIVGADIVTARGGRIGRFDLLAGRSTTRIVSRIARQSRESEV